MDIHALRNIAAAWQDRSEKAIGFPGISRGNAFKPSRCFLWIHAQ